MNRVLQTLLRIFVGLAAYVFVVTVVLINGWGFGDKELFDWLDILIFPAVLAVRIYLLNIRQSRREREADERRRHRELDVENQRAQDTALQAYLDKMEQLLLDQERPLRSSQPENEVRTLARARTLTILGRLDPDRKRSVLQFVYELGLISKEQLPFASPMLI